MANDRIYLVCRSCHESVVIWKHYPVSGGYFPGDHIESSKGRLGRFIEAHLERHDNLHVSTFGPMAPFYAATESTPLPITDWVEGVRL